MGLAQFAHVHATVLDAGEVVVAEGHNVQILSGRIAVEDSHVLVVAIQLEQGQAHVGGLLIAELATTDFDLTVVTSLTGQGATGRLRAHDVLLAALSVNIVDHFVELAEVQSTATVGEVLGGTRLDASGQAVELGGGLVGVAVDEQSFPSHAHCTHAGLHLVGLGVSAFEVHDSAVNLDVATEELQALGLLAHFGVRLSQGAVVVTESDIGQTLFTLPEQAVAFDGAEGEYGHELTTGQFGHNSQLLRSLGMLLSFEQSKCHF